MKRRVAVPGLLSDLVRNGVLAIEGLAFDLQRPCPHCGGETSGYDIRSRVFAPLLEDGAIREITVTVKRFGCSECGRVSSADAPFYRGARYGAPIVDFALALSDAMPLRRAAKVLSACHIGVNWGTIRSYRRLDIAGVPLMPLFGIPLPISLLNLSLLWTQLHERGSIEGAEALAACRPPPADRTPPDVLRLLQKRDERDKE